MAKVRRFERQRGARAAADAKREAGWALFKDAVQARAAELPDVFWVDGILIVTEPEDG